MVVAALLAGIGPALGAAAWLRTKDGRELTGEFSVADGALMLASTNGAPVKVALTNVREAKFNLTNTAGLKSGQGKGKPDTALPAPWSSSQVGQVDPGAVGSAEFREGTFTLRGAGGIPKEGRGSDAVYFVHRPLRGDGELVARIVGLDGTAAGLMVRAAQAKESPMATIYMQAREVLSYRSRSTNGKGETRDRPYIALPRWVRLKRDGNEVKGYLSWDGGERWESFLNSRVEMGSDVLIGMFVASGDTMQTREGRFDNVTFSAGNDSRNSSGRAPTHYAVVLENGSVLTAESFTADSSAVKMVRRGKTLTVSGPKVARLLFDRFGEADGGKAVPNRPGALLSGGDFLDGEFNGLERNEVKMGSVLFGIRSYRAGGQVKAVSLRALVPLATGFIVETSDGSVWRTPTVKLEAGELVVESPAQGTVRLPWREVQSLSPSMSAAR
jgi:hypothetical protein